MERIANSILQDIKQMLGQEHDDDSFDVDITIHINSVFSSLHMLGVGPKEGYEIESSANLWKEFTNDLLPKNAVKSYIYARVRLLFDPPTNAFLVSNLDKQIEKAEWILMVESDPPVEPSELGDINE